jgi:hypothetical protein
LTHTLWEADDGGGDGLGNDDCTGSAYNDSVFDESWTIDFDANSIVQTVAAGERHDGTAGSGARNISSTKFIQVGGYTSAITINLEWLELHLSAASGTDGDEPIRIFDGDVTFSIQNMLLHGMSVFRGGPRSLAEVFGSSSSNNNISNNILYDITNTFTGSAEINAIERTGGNVKILNNTVFDVHSDGNSQVHGISHADDATVIVQNDLVVDTTGTGAEDFKVDSPSNSTMDHNLSSDATASGTGSLINKASADQFVSTSPVNLHLKSGADAIDAGTDLGTTPSGVEVDIDGLNRDTDPSNDPWDMGAHEFVAAGGAFPYHSRRLLRGDRSLFNDRQSALIGR